MNRRSAVLGLTAAVAGSVIDVKQPAIARSGTPLPDSLRLTPPPDRPVLVAVLVGPMATVIDFAGPWEVFESVSTPGKYSGFQLAMVSDTLAPIEATGGMIITPRYTYSTAPQPDVILMGAQGGHTPEKISYITERSKPAQLVMSVCTGAFLLAKTGLLDGLKATTHHDFYDAFAKKFPKIDLVRGPRYVENGKICTAGGLSSGIELALRVVQRYFGDEKAGQTAYYMEYNRSDKKPSA